jgi:hypothetical protein
MATIIMTIYLIKYSMYFCSALYKQFLTVHLLNIYKYIQYVTRDLKNMDAQQVGGLLHLGAGGVQVNNRHCLYS